MTYPTPPTTETEEKPAAPPPVNDLDRLKSPALGRFLMNTALIAIAYFVFTGGQWNFFFVLFAALGVTFSTPLYRALEQRFTWAFWALLGFGALVAALGIYRAVT